MKIIFVLQVGGAVPSSSKSPNAYDIESAYSVLRICKKKRLWLLGLQVTCM